MSTNEDFGKIGVALGLFASVIKSGEQWSPGCEAAMVEAQFALSRIGDALETAEHRTLDTLAEAIRKFAPDLAETLAKRWVEASTESDAALEDFLKVLRNIQ